LCFDEPRIAISAYRSRTGVFARRVAEEKESCPVAIRSDFRGDSYQLA
jgi:hypothetical protein